MRLGLVGVVVASVLSGTSLSAQQPVRREINVLPSGQVLDFAPDGGWRVKARQVAANRQRMLSQGAMTQLNAPVRAGVAIAGSAAAISGTERVPVILFRFSDHGTAATQFDTTQYNSVLFGDTPPNGRPYTVKTLYKEMSNNLLTIQGAAYGWFTLPSTEVTYTGPPGGCPYPTVNPYNQSGNCNGIWGSGFASMRTGLNAALQLADPAVDWTQYDNDGPDGTPNSGDDDGKVDLVIFVQSEEDGACNEATNNHPWSHKSSGLGYSTHSLRPNGQPIIVDSYTMQSGVGGSGACATNQIMPIGTAAHETGHTFGLPDLYDVGGNTEGIGEWGLMGSGNYTAPFSPTRMEAWSLSRLGWVTVRMLSTSGTYSLGAAPTSDTAFMIRVQGGNSRGEYYLVENRMAVQSDSAVIRLHCQASGFAFPASCGGGLAVWHIDSAKVVTSLSANRVNNLTPQGVALEQADGNNSLRTANSNNRGDAGDLWPGTTNRTTFGVGTNPAAVKNVDGSYVGFALDSIKVLVPNGAMSFRLTFGGLAVVRALDMNAQISVDGVKYNRFAQVLSDGTTHTIAMDSAQSADGLTQYLFGAWSDGGARTHTVTAHQAGDSISATVTTKFLLKATVVGTGTVGSPIATAAALAAGQFIPKDSVVMVIATPPIHGVLDTWVGDTIASGDTLTLAMTRPFSVAANFLAPGLSASAVTQQLLGVSTALDKSDIRYLDLLGNKNGKFDIGDFLSWVKETGATPSAQRVAMQPTPAVRVVTVAKRGEQ